MNSFSFVAKFLILANIFLSPVQNFPPARLISDGLNLFKDHLDEVNKTFSHEEILERGLFKSVAKYFALKQNGTQNNSVSSNITIGLDDVIDLKRLFLDYKNEVYCQIGLEKVLREKLQPAVILVDVKQRTSKLPHAHFDAETFRESNQRVINFTNLIVDLIMNGSYDRALRKSGQVLHTIQDFYSHSNWIELGNAHEINRKIGTDSFLNTYEIAGRDDPACELDGCITVEIPCVEELIAQTAKLVSSITGLDMSAFSKCPIRYYKCDQSNVVKNNTKLVSGYVVNEKQEDGTAVVKPIGKMKCSHGGLFDNSSYEPSRGGINKDSGSYLLSPRADLHLVAASLAIEHTEFFFDSIRDKVGDQKFEDFLSLNDNQKGNFIKNLFFPCQTSNANKMLGFSKNFILILAMFYYLTFLN